MCIESIAYLINPWSREAKHAIDTLLKEQKRHFVAYAMIIIPLIFGSFKFYIKYLIINIGVEV